MQKKSGVDVEKIAIIDLGSNSVRLVIYEISDNGSFRLIDDISNVIRLSADMKDGKYINDMAIMRTLKTIKLFSKLCSSYNVPKKNIIAVATAAVRKAENKDYFLRLLYSSTGINFKLISGDEEALYVYKAVIHTLDVDEGIIVDIGGGSTEIIKFSDNNISGLQSIPVGTIVATEQFLDKDKISSKSIKTFEQYLESTFKDLFWMKEKKTKCIIGLGGALRNISKIHRKKTNYSVDIVHNYSMSIDDFLEIYESLKTMDLASRKKVAGMSSKRADIIVGAFLIIKVISKLCGAKKFVTSGNGLREGLLLDYIFTHYPLKQQKDVLCFSLENYIDVYGVRKNHADHITTLAMCIFNDLFPLHHMGEDARKVLMVSSLLHDIGIAVEFYGHSLHSYYMIINSRLNGLTHREIVLSAIIAASHSKDKMKNEWIKEHEGLLAPEDIRLIEVLSVILKISNCFDRSETGIIKSVECIIDNDTVRMKTLRYTDAELELKLAREHEGLFNKIFNKNLIII